MKMIDRKVFKVTETAEDFVIGALKRVLYATERTNRTSVQFYRLMYAEPEQKLVTGGSGR